MSLTHYLETRLSQSVAGHNLFRNLWPKSTHDTHHLVLIYCTALARERKQQNSLEIIIYRFVLVPLPPDVHGLCLFDIGSQVVDHAVRWRR